MTTIDRLVERYDQQITAETDKTLSNGEYWHKFFFEWKPNAYTDHCEKVRNKVSGRSARVFRRLMDIEINAEIGRFE